MQHTLTVPIPPRRPLIVFDGDCGFCRYWLARWRRVVGDRFDADKLQAYPPGSVVVLPGDTSHFHWAKSSEYVTQVTAIGPLGLEYLSAEDDPRSNQS